MNEAEGLEAGEEAAPSDRDLSEAVDASLTPGSSSDPMISSLAGAY